MSSYDRRGFSRGDFPFLNEFVGHTLQGTIYYTSGWLDLCAQSLLKKVKMFWCFRVGLLSGVCSLLPGQKFSFANLANSSCVMTPCGGFVFSSYPGRGAYKQEPFSLKIIESLTDCMKREHFFSIIVRDSAEFLDRGYFTWCGWRSHVKNYHQSTK